VDGLRHLPGIGPGQRLLHPRDLTPFTDSTRLSAPATRPDRCAKAAEAGADVLITDLEDAVAPADKPRARAALEHLAAPAEAGPLRALSVNGLDTRVGLAAAEAIAAATPRLNEEDQHSLWPKFIDIPTGWQAIFGPHHMPQKRRPRRSGAEGPMVER
jgi:hypothetical protein